MNSYVCTSIILKNIQENAHLFEKNRDIKNLPEIICKLGALVLQKSLPCTLLKNILLTLKKLNDNSIISSVMYKSFVKDVNNFYKSQNLCIQYKLCIISCFAPALEIELLSLLKLCATVTNIQELVSVRSAVENSVLIQACVENKANVQKIINILKEAFIQSEGNPVVGYLTFQLFNVVEQPCFPLLLPKEIHSLNILFQLPHNLLNCEEQELFIKHLIHLCTDSINLNLCSKTDILFYIAAFPVFYYNILNLYTTQKSYFILDFLKLLCITEKLKSRDWISDVLLMKTHYENLFLTNSSLKFHK